MARVELSVTRGVSRETVSGSACLASIGPAKQYRQRVDVTSDEIKAKEHRLRQNRTRARERIVYGSDVRVSASDHPNQVRQHIRNHHCGILEIIMHTCSAGSS